MGVSGLPEGGREHHAAPSVPVAAAPRPGTIADFRQADHADRTVVSHIPSQDPHGNGSDYSVDGFPGMTKESGNRSERVRSPVAGVVASQVLRMSSPDRADACPSSPLGAGPAPP